MNKFTLIVGLLLCASLAYAQSWSNVGYTPGLEIAYEQNGNTVWKLTSNNIYKSTNGGNSWSQGIDADSAPFYAEDYLPSEFGTFYPIFDERDSRVFGDFMFLSLRTNFSNREYWTTPDAGQTFNKFEFDADFFSEAYDLGNNRYMVQVADFDINAPSNYVCKWFYSDNGGQSFNQVIFDYGRYANIVGTTNTSIIIHDMDKIYYRNFSNFSQTNVITLPEECEMVRVEGNLIQAASYDVTNSQTATSFTLFTSTNGGGSFTSETSTKPTGFQFDYSIIDNYLFIEDFDVYRYNLDNFSAGPTIFSGETYPQGPFKKTLDGRVVNSKPKNFIDPFFISSNFFDTFQPSAKVPYTTEGLVEFDNTFGRIYGSDTYTTSDGIAFQQRGDFFGSALKSDLVYLDKSMSLSLYADPSSTSYFTNDGFNFETTNEQGIIASNFAGDAAFYQAGPNLIADPVANLDSPELFTSANNGNSFSIIPNSYTWGRTLFADQKTGTLYAYTSSFSVADIVEKVYISRSDDNGVTWKFIENGLSNVSSRAMVGRYGRPLMAYNNHILFRDENRLLLSSDGGISFNEVSLPNSFQDACVWIDNDKLHVSTKDEKLFVSDLNQYLANPAPRQNGYQVDLELSIRLEPENPPPFSNFDVVVTIENAGSETANNISVRRPFLGQPVAVNRGDEQPSYTGSFNWLNASNNSLAPGETATASFPYYRLDGGEIQTRAWIAAGLQPDVDSRYGAIVDLDNPEDDEAIYPAPNNNGTMISINCPGNVFKQEATSAPPIGTGFTGFGDVILPRPTATTTCPGGITSIEYVGTAPTFELGGDLYLDGPGEYAIFWEIKDACGNIETCLYSAEVLIPSFVYQFTDCPNDIIVDAATGANGAIVNYNTQVTSDCPAFPDLISITQGFSPGSFFPIGTTPVTLMSTNQQCGSTSCSFNVIVNAGSTAGSGVDLELSMTQSVASPTAFNAFQRTVTVLNAGNNTAGSFEISIPTFAGMVLSGGNEFSATRGTFGAHSDQVWRIPSLGIGQTAQITLNYFPLENITSAGYAQVINMVDQDVDSTPNNGTPPTVNEDDEASTSGSTVVPLFWENCPNDIVMTAPAGSNGMNVNYTNPTLNTNGCPFLISNSGTNFESGDFFPIGTSTVTIFAGNPQCGTAECSFDVIIEEDGGTNSPLFWENCPDDVVLTAPSGSNGLVVNYTNPTLNTNGCPFLISNSGTNFESGDFFPIGTSTVTIFAGNPQCGTVECSFDVTIESGNIGSMGIDLELDMTQSTSQPVAYTTFTREVIVNNTGSLVANNIEIEIPIFDGMVFSGGEEFTTNKGVFSPYATQNIWSISQLAAGETATITLRYFPLQTITTAGYAQVISMSGQDIDSTPNNGTPPTVNEDDEASTNGGGTPPTQNLPDLTVSNVNIPSTLAKGTFVDYTFDLNNIGSIFAGPDYTIDLSLRNNTSNVNVFVGDVKTGNTFPGTIADVAAQIFIPSYLQNGSYTLIIEVDADGDIMESNENNNIVTLPVQIGGSTLQGADIELAVEQISLASRFNTYTISYTASNNGTTASNDVQVSIPVPDGVVLSGGDEFDATKGTLGIYFDDVWRIGSLSPGETVEIDVNYYKLSTGNISHYAQVSFSAEDDPDSTPNNGICCNAIEDDEASLTANAVAARTSDPATTELVQEISMEISPNPAAGSMVNLEIYSTSEQEQEISIYDLLGREVSTQKFYLYEGKNKLKLSIQSLASGMYQVVLLEQDKPATIKKLVIEK